jgi:uncharacterized protein YkwD
MPAMREPRSTWRRWRAPAALGAVALCAAALSACTSPRSAPPTGNKVPAGDPAQRTTTTTGSTTGATTPAASPATTAGATDAPSPGCAGPSAGAAGTFAADFTRELNQLRADPPRYAAFVRDRYATMDAQGIYLQAGMRIRSVEGRAAVDETLAFLQRTAAQPPLRLAPCASAAAADHVRDQGPRGLTGHVGSDGSNPSQRVSRRSGAPAYCGEVISYGSQTARDVVIDFLVDDGVPSRGHRKQLVDGRYRTLGAASGPHQSIRTMAVVVLCLNDS